MRGVHAAVMVKSARIGAVGRRTAGSLARAIVLREFRALQMRGIASVAPAAPARPGGMPRSLKHLGRVAIRSLAGPSGRARELAPEAYPLSTPSWCLRSF